MATISPEVQVAQGALMEVGRSDLVPLIFGGRCPCWRPNWDAFLWGDWPVIAKALVLGHQVHDRAAHLDDNNSVCCPSCGVPLAGGER